MQQRPSRRTVGGGGGSRVRHLLLGAGSTTSSGVYTAPLAGQTALERPCAPCVYVSRLYACSLTDGRAGLSTTCLWHKRWVLFACLAQLTSQPSLRCACRECGQGFHLQHLLIRD